MCTRCGSRWRPILVFNWLIKVSIAPRRRLMLLKQFCITRSITLLIFSSGTRGLGTVLFSTNSSRWSVQSLHHISLKYHKAGVAWPVCSFSSFNAFKNVLKTMKPFLMRISKKSFFASSGLSQYSKQSLFFSISVTTLFAERCFSRWWRSMSLNKVSSCFVNICS